MGYPIGFMERDNTSGLHQSRHLGHNLLRLRNIDQDEAGRGKVEGLSFQTGGSAVSLANLRIGYASVRQEAPGGLDSGLA